MYYTKLTDFASKDALLSGNPSKLVRGTELGAEFDAIATAIATKYDSATLGASSGSSLVGFIQSGTGAVSTTVQAKLRESVSVLDFGAAGDGVTDDTAAIQAAENHCAGTSKALTWPAGVYKTTATINKLHGVDWYGAGKNLTVIQYAGDTLAVDARGTSVSRRIFSIKNMTIRGASYVSNAVGIKIAWNMRSLPLLEDVGINNFGHYGIHFTGDNWLVYFNNVEIHDCGRTVTNSCGIYREPAFVDINALADIKFFDCVIEACGSASSTAGGVNFQCASPYATQGLWFHGCDIEGNFGTLENYFTNVDHLSISECYVECAYFGTPKTAFEFNGCNVAFTSNRVSSDAGNIGGRALYCAANTNLHLSGGAFDSDFGSADIELANNSFLSGGNDFQYSVVPLRLVKDATSGLQGLGMQVAAWGRFNGVSGSVARQCGENFASVSRVSAGTYTVTFLKPLPNANYVVCANAEDGSSHTALHANAAFISNGISFTLVVETLAGVAVDGRQVSFQVFAEY